MRNLTNGWSKKGLTLMTAILAILAMVTTLRAEEVKTAAPTLSQEGAWTMIVIPDPQQYTSTRNYPIYEIMMNWIVENQKPLDIRQVVCVGDLVNRNSDRNQWEFSSRAFKILDGKLPYALATGNHDFGEKSETSDNRTTNFNDYFPADRNPAINGVLVEMGENSFGKKTLENAAYKTTTPSGQTVLTIILPFAPTDANLAWAQGVAARPEFADAFVVVATHQYMLPGARENKIDEDRGYKLLQEGGNQGKDMWEKLIFPSKNIRLVLCGHHSGVDHFADCVGFRIDKNSAGRDVAQMVFDTQALGGGWGGNGGDGWLRLLEFSPDMKTIKAITWSPFFALSPSTREMAREKSDYNEFEFHLD